MQDKDFPSLKLHAYSIFVGGIPGSYKPADVAREFEHYGQVMRVIVPRDLTRPGNNLGHCTVSFANS